VDQKQSKAGDKMISARFQVAKGDFKDRLIFENFMITHSNSKVTEISQRKLTDLYNAVGLDVTGEESLPDLVAGIGETFEIPFLAGVEIKEPYTNGKGEVKTDNRIASYSAR
jgi:Protein of unknown function (DUF669)